MRFGGLIAAIVFAAIAAVIVLKMTDTPPPAQPGPAPAAQIKTVNVYVAAKAIPIGSTLTQDMLAIQPWPEHLVLPGFIVADASAPTSLNSKTGVSAANIIGTIARAPFQQQEPIISSKLANPNDPNFLAAGLPKGMRVITIQTNEAEGVAGFVFPGDHVDVILTHDVSREKVESNTTVTANAGGETSETHIQKMPFTDPISETLINNVTVVAVDQHADGAGATDREGKLVVPRSVSLMVSQIDAQRIRLGQKIGTLTLSLRSLSDRDSADPMTIVGSENISQYHPPAAEVEASDSSSVTVYRGVKNDTTATGSAPSSKGPSLSTQQIPAPSAEPLPGNPVRPSTPAKTGQ